MEWIKQLVDRVRSGKQPDVPQLPPRQRDPVNGQNAIDAFLAKKTGETAFVNPFHAENMQFFERILRNIRDEPDVHEFVDRMDLNYSKAIDLLNFLDGEIIERRDDERRMIIRPVEELKVNSK